MKENMLELENDFCDIEVKKDLCGVDRVDVGANFFPVFTNINKIDIISIPKKPNSSEIIENIKSVCGSGK